MNTRILITTNSNIILLILVPIIQINGFQESHPKRLLQIILNSGKLNYGEVCDNSSKSELRCDSQFYCYKNKCKCPIGYGYSDPNSSFYVSKTSKCLKFDEFSCLKDSDCQEMDNNRLCNQDLYKCECRKGYYENEDNMFCNKVKPKLNKTCFSDSDCDIDYTHCKNSVCECWPEFELLGNADYNHNNNYCIRKICSSSYNCQTSDNPNLICNNTICECEYGYSFDSRRICLKMTKRQNCNITCQIIGGLFASIFMLSLIYWCFYCCYSIVKNYKCHNQNTICANNSPNDNSPENERFTQSLNNPNIVIRRDHFPDHSSDQSDDYRYSYYYESDNPPTYSQLLDPPPDYETVLNMKLNE